MHYLNPGSQCNSLGDHDTSHHPASPGVCMWVQVVRDCEAMGPAPAMHCSLMACLPWMVATSGIHSCPDSLPAGLQQPVLAAPDTLLTALLSAEVLLTTP
jgi:hypothetical protein